jgi:hypothetical protein
VKVYACTFVATVYQVLGQILNGRILTERAVGNSVDWIKPSKVYTKQAKSVALSL